MQLTSEGSNYKVCSVLHSSTLPIFPFMSPELSGKYEYHYSIPAVFISVYFAYCDQPHGVVGRVSDY
jgi:hypothetical protein